MKECIMIITGYITLVKYLLLKLQLDTIKLLKIKKIARSILYQENRKCVRKAHTKRLEELRIKLKVITPAMKTLTIKN